jgi:predicted DNA-binding transcriptional regulator AlpA
MPIGIGAPRLSTTRSCGRPFASQRAKSLVVNPTTGRAPRRHERAEHSLMPVCVEASSIGAILRHVISDVRQTEENSMSQSAHVLPPRFLRTAEAARFLGLSARTLEKHRTYGTGPVYRKLGGRIVYAISDLQRWADRGLRTSTSDHGTDIVYPAQPVMLKKPFRG